mmetsp:Transcript_11466/g.32211  ORF Transcript_11466/g.32211 Transcript_11466/m.32211 type:complete len:310 (-) Transcript_11466:2-931(-)
MVARRIEELDAQRIISVLRSVREDIAEQLQSKSIEEATAIPIRELGFTSVDLTTVQHAIQSEYGHYLPFTTLLSALEDNLTIAEFENFARRGAAGPSQSSSTAPAMPRDSSLLEGAERLSSLGRHSQLSPSPSRRSRSPQATRRKSSSRLLSKSSNRTPRGKSPSRERRSPKKERSPSRSTSFLGEGKLRTSFKGLLSRSEANLDHQDSKNARSMMDRRRPNNASPKSDQRLARDDSNIQGPTGVGIVASTLEDGRISPSDRWTRQHVSSTSPGVSQDRISPAPARPEEDGNEKRRIVMGAGRVQREEK